MISLASLSDYGTHDDSEFPELWQGCVGAWEPCLGPSGIRLHDFSRSVNWGTLTNMDAATDWVVGGGQYALDFDGVNDYVLTSALLRPGTSDFSISLWWNGKNTTQFGAIFGTRQTGFTGSDKLIALCQGNFITGGTGKQISFGLLDTISRYRSWITTANIDDGNYHHIVACVAGSVARIFVDAVEQSLTLTSVGTTPVIDAGGFVSLGAGNDGAIPVSGCLDDVLVYNYALNSETIRLLSRQRGIAYTPRRRRRRYVPATGARRLRLLTGMV